MKNKKIQRRQEKKIKTQSRKQQKKNKQDGLHNEHLAQNMNDQRLEKESKELSKYIAWVDSLDD